MSKTIDLSEWEYVAVQGNELVGKVDSKKPRTLSPVLSVLRPFVPVAGGGLWQALLLRPFLGIGLRTLMLPEGALRIPLEAFGRGNEEQWARLIAEVLEGNDQLLTHASGLLIPDH